MKKILGFILAIMLFNSMAFAADNLSFGIKTGLSSGSASFTNISGMNSDSKMGYSVGVFMEYAITNEFSVQPEILYSSRPIGLSTSNVSGSYSGEYLTNISLSFIEIPILFKYNINKQFNVFAGPCISFRQTARSTSEGVSKYKFDNGVVKIEHEEGSEYDIASIIKGTSYSLVFGGGYNINNNFTIDFRYNLGLTNLNTSSEDTALGITPSSCLLSLGYKF